MSKKNLWLLSAGMIALAGSVSPALAQESQPQNSAAEDQGVIIVTATRRASPLSDVPIEEIATATDG